jgi:hypothetical protein
MARGPSPLPHLHGALAPTTELYSALLDGTPVPAPERVEPFAFLEDELLPLTLTPVEPTAFVLACVQAAWGPRGPKN